MKAASDSAEALSAPRGFRAHCCRLGSIPAYSDWRSQPHILLRRTLAVLFRSLDRLAQRRVYHLLARSARPLVTDHPLVVDHVERRRGGEVPLRRDRSRTGVAGIDKGPPGYVLLVHHVLELLHVEATDVDADEG